MKLNGFLAACFAMSCLSMGANVVNVGSGSYSDAFPGTDEAGRNAYPPGDPQVSGRAATRPIPTNDWWSSELINNHGETIFNYPMCISPRDNGLRMINVVHKQAMPQDEPLTIGLTGLNAPQTTVCDHSDWTVSINWADRMTATVGMGMPFVYFEKSDNSDVSIHIGIGSARVDGNILLVNGSYNGSSYAVYAPAGSTWNLSGNTATSNLGGKSYWSVLMLQKSDAGSVARDMERYAFVFPGDTRAEFTYNEAEGRVIAKYSVTPVVKEGTGSTVLMGLLPHHYNNLSGSVDFTGLTYKCIRGQLRMAATNSFTTSLRYGGVLPTIPSVQTEASGYSQAELMRLIDAVNNNTGLQDWTDSYNDGQLLNRLVQNTRVAKEMGYEAGFTKGMATVKKHVERWLKYSQGDIAFMFYYHKPFTTLLGYPAGHGQDSNINDHHFHWGYFIHAAAFIEQYNPGWAEQWGGMISLLIRDAASSDREDPMFPYLRSFSPYAGHCWANGFATIGLGNDQESTSESMQFNCSLIHWGAVTGNKAIRDLGVCLYTIERSATEEYWFNVNGSVESNGKALYSRIFGNDHDSMTFWTTAIEAAYGIEIYPVHAGSFYLVNRPEFAQKLWKAMCNETGILQNQDNDNIWYDTWLQFLSMLDPQEALRLYNGCTHLGNKFGISQAQTYQQVHAMAALGTPRQDITADYPLATAFDNNGSMTYAVQNYTDRAFTVTFSDGVTLTAQPRSLTTSRATSRNPIVTLDLSATKAKPGDKVVFNVSIDEGDHTVVRSVIKVNGVEVNSKSHASAALRAASKTHSLEWTAPDEEGDYTVTAEAVNAEGRVFTSAAKTVTVKAEGGDQPGPDDPNPGTGECVQRYVWSASDDTNFMGDYTVTYSTEGDNIVITAEFKGDYVGLAGPWVWEDSNGFRELGMMNDNGDGTYSYVFGDAEAHHDYHFSLKIAFAGGQANTEYYSYRLGQKCMSGVGEISETSLAVYPNPSSDVITVEVPGICGMTVYGPTGATIHSESVDTVTTVDVSGWAKGVYFIRFVNGRGDSNVVTFIKK